MININDKFIYIGINDINENKIKHTEKENLQNSQALIKNKNKNDIKEQR